MVPAESASCSSRIRSQTTAFNNRNGRPETSWEQQATRSNLEPKEWTIKVANGVPKTSVLVTVPKGIDGLHQTVLVRGYKGKEADREVCRIDPGVVSLLAELRGHERQAAEELEHGKTGVNKMRRRRVPNVCKLADWCAEGSFLHRYPAAKNSIARGRSAY